MSQHSNFDLVIKNVCTLDKEDVDIGIKDGIITQVGVIEQIATSYINAAHHLLIPGFVNIHTHLDKADLIQRMTPEHFGGTLEQNRKLAKALKASYSVEEVKERARNVAKDMLVQGVTAVRTHVDVDPTVGLVPMKAILELKRELENVMTLEICAFPQEGIVPVKNRELVEEAIKMGANVVGGLPIVEANDDERLIHIDNLFDIAKKYDKSIEIQIDESNDPRNFLLPYLVQRTLEENFEGRVTATHCISLSTVQDDIALATMDKLAKADISVVVTPSCNLITQFLSIEEVKCRPHNSITRVKELRDRGINIALGTDNIRDIFYPLGNASMLREIHVLATTTRMTGPQDITDLFEMATVNGARLMRLNYGIQTGMKADLVILNAGDLREALCKPPVIPYVIKNGHIITVNRLKTESHL